VWGARREKRRRTLCTNRKGCGTPNFNYFNQEQPQLQTRGKGSTTRLELAIGPFVKNKFKNESLAHPAGGFAGDDLS
jgi:hypothetical protein